MYKSFLLAASVKEEIVTLQYKHFWGYIVIKMSAI